MSRRKSAGRSGQIIDVDAIGRSITEFGFDQSELADLAAAAAARHARVMRVRPDRQPPTDAGEPVPFYPRAFRVAAGTPAPSRRIAYAAGDYYLQDAGSLLALAVAGAGTDRLRGQMVCDLCASPGGKASALLESIGDGFLVANEPISSRLAPLAYNLARTGSDRYAITSRDPDELADSMSGRFDLILVDAPCSGQTMVGRGKQSRSSAAGAMIAVNVARQRRILAAAVRLLRPGGRLVYSTCTFAVAENEDQIRWLSQETGLIADPQTDLQPYASDLAPACYRTWPHRDGCDGSFAASMRLPADAASSVNDQFGSIGDPLDAAATAAMADFYGPVTSAALIQRDWIVEGWTAPPPQWIGPIAGGPEWMHRSGKTWRPSHAAALRSVIPTTHQIELSDTRAARYLTGEAIQCDRRGWSIVTHQARPLGWIKGDGRVGKNHLPGHARTLRVEGPSIDRQS